MNELQAKFLEISEEQAKSIKSQLSQLSFDEKKEAKTDRKFKVIASTETTDRSGEIIKADGWDYEHFMKNPVILANHIYKIENIVGKATRIGVEDGKLIIEGVFSKSNPLGVLLADLYDEGMVKTVSVGFIPKQRQEDNRRIITSAELLELSFVAVPCNPEALSLDQKELMQKGIEAGILQLEKKEEPEQKSELEAFKAEIL
ncbi:MAG: HK97 family phage prohead protease [bacterium]|nr:HK97 family phage prohead protease [bacterium]